MAVLRKSQRLKKELTLFDVYAISTGAMFSSGFFLLPGLAAAQAGPSVVLAYLFAGAFILPAMLSVAELSTAMPRAGGAYYFLDRSLGPMVGTVGGLGTWLALALKSAFALIGMGAYLALLIELPIKPLAVALTLVFMLVNIFGAKETSGLQRFLVIVLLVILAFFLVQGLFEVFELGPRRVAQEQFTPFMPFGVQGLIATVGFVFVSYAGLTKVASVSEEVHDPERNIPLGMMLSLLTATFVYVVGVYIMVAVLNAEELRSDLTPVATAAAAFFDWLPEPVGLILIVIAAIMAFASTGNAGILSASRYPLAMARDQMIWSRFGEIGRFRTPAVAIVATSALMILCILVLDVEQVAKLASAFQLLLFSLLNLAVIVMRESRIESYDPGYRSPLYPWMQIFGLTGPFWLITEMGWLPSLFSIGFVALGMGWYFYYVRPKVARGGAIYHVFALLGQRRFEGLDRELRSILKEKGLREEDPFDEVVARAEVIDFREPAAFPEVAERAAQSLAWRLGLDAASLAEGFTAGTGTGTTPVARGVALPHLRLPQTRHPEMVLVRCASGVEVKLREGLFDDEGTRDKIRALFFLISPQGNPGQHLRILAQIATRVDDEDFMEEWLAAGDEQELKEVVLRDERFLSLRLQTGSDTGVLVGRELRELEMPQDSLVAMIRRNDQVLVPRGSTRLQEGDRLTIIGSPEGMQELEQRYGARGAGLRAPRAAPEETRLSTRSARP